MDRSSNPVVKSNSKFAVRLHRRCWGMVSSLLLSAMSLGFNGCCTPFGPGCDAGHCYDCDGTNRPIPLGPFQGLKQQLTCGGGGCGEVYIGEWISTPPDCTDPCCDDQFVGGAVPSQPFCWTLGGLLNPQRFSGRFAGGRSLASCDDCGEGCDSCGAGEYVDGGHVDGGYVNQPYVEMAPSQSSGGCATCARSRMTGGDANTRQMIPVGQSTRYAQAPSSSRTTARTASPNLNGNTTYGPPASQRSSQPVPANSRPAPVARAINTGYLASPSSSQDQVRQASAVDPDSGSSTQSNYAPRTGASRNRVLN